MLRLLFLTLGCLVLPKLGCHWEGQGEGVTVLNVIYHNSVFVAVCIVCPFQQNRVGETSLA